MDKPGRVLVVHEEVEVADMLCQVLAARGFRVARCESLERAVGRLAGNDIDAIVVAWDHPLGRSVFRWALEERPGLRPRFVFVVEHIPALMQAEARRRRVAQLGDVDGVVDAVRVTCARHRKRTRPRPRFERRPRVLLVDDDALDRHAMAGLLHAAGYDVITSESVRTAEAWLESTPFDVVLSDWCIGDSIGSELRRWMSSRCPQQLGALVFVTAGEVDGPRQVVWPVPVLPKGQDSPELFAVLERAVAARDDAKDPPAVTA